MSGKILLLVITMTVLSVAIAGRRNVAIDGETTSSKVYAVTVEVDSLRVISYLDDAGNQHPADSTLVPPVPLRGAREFTVEVNRSTGDSSRLSGRPR